MCFIPSPVLLGNPPNRSSLAVNTLLSRRRFPSRRRCTRGLLSSFRVLHRWTRFRLERTLERRREGFNLLTHSDHLVAILVTSLRNSPQRLSVFIVSNAYAGAPRSLRVSFCWAGARLRRKLRRARHRFRSPSRCARTRLTNTGGRARA